MRHDRLPGRLVLALHKDPGTAMPHALMTPAADEVLWWFRDEEAEALAAPFRKLPEGVERGYVLNPRASCPEGWEAQHTSGLWVPGDGKLPALLDALTVVRPVQSPDTERVPWWEALNRQVLVDGEARKVISVGMESDDAKPHFNTQSLIEGDFADKGYFPPYGADGTVEVIA